MSAVLAFPDLAVEADGQTLTDEFLRSLCEVRVQQRLSVPTLCELSFRDASGALVDARSFRPGTLLRVAVDEHRETLFAGEVTALEHVYEPSSGREIRVRAYDLLHRLRKRQEVRAHVQVSVLDLASELAGKHGILVEAAEPGVFLPFLIQHRQSDLDLLTEVAERSGLYLTLREETLHLLTLEGVGESLPLHLGTSLLEARIEVNGDPACREVEVASWDPLLARAHRGRAARPRSARVVPVEAPPDAFGLSGSRHLVDEAAQSDGHARSLAQSELDGRVAREVTLWGVAEGDPWLRPGARVALSGVEPELAGQYVLCEVTHVVDERGGYTSEISTSPPPPRPRARGAVASIGIVSRVDDPDSLGRVRATLPTFEDVETEWMNVMSLGAGQGKGLVLLPEVGDRVLVLLAHEDPAQGVVLGGLYGDESPPDSGVEGGAVQRYTLRTRGGETVQLDDARGAVRVEDRQGSFFELTPEGIRLHSRADLVVEAPGRRVVVRGGRIDFESG